MRRRLSAIFLAAITLFSVLLPLAAQGVVTAAGLTDAQIAKLASDTCNNHSFDLPDQLSQNLNPGCADGFVNGYKHAAQPQGCASTGPVDNSGFATYTGMTDCQIGYNLGTSYNVPSNQSGKTPAPSNVSSSLAAEAKAYCSNRSDGGQHTTNCQNGFEWGYKNANQPSPCDQFCVNGYAQGRTLYQAIPSQCQGWASSAYGATAVNACEAGVSAKSSGKGNPCGKYNDKQKEKTACTDGYSTTSVSSSSQTTGTDGKNLTCDLEFTNLLTWAICPIIDALVKIVDLVDGMITDALTINTATIFCTTANSSCSAYYTAWQSFRNIALGLLVIAGLIIVTAQALGMEILDAYTIKKALPRLLVASIGITLSWPLMQFAVSMSNDLGFGIRHLIYAPFAGIKDNINLDFTGGITNILFGGVATGAVAVAAVPVWIAAGGIGVLLSYVATAALAVLIALVVLVLRQVAIILMIIMAPLALVAYILPNTEKMYKFWWESFSKALLMFPLIAGFIAAGRVFSAVTLQNSDNPVSGFLGFAAYFAPYFLIPATFKLAGGALRQIGGFVNDRSRGGFDRLRKYRGDTMKNRVGRARARGLYKSDKGLSGLANRIGFWTLEADHRIPQGLGQNKRLSRMTGGFATQSGVGLSEKLFGGMAQEMAGMKGKAAAEHDQKALQQNPHHYAMDYAALGMREKFAKDLNPETLRRLDDQFGTHEVYDASAVIKNADGTETRGGMVTRWGGQGKSLPDTTDTLGWAGFAKQLETGSRAGSQARKAGEDLGRNAGVLTRLGLHEDTQRATIRSVAVANLAQNGKLSPDDQARLFGEDIEAAGGDISGLAIANARSNQNESLSGNARHATRHGKAVGQLEDGTTFSFLSNKEVVDKTGQVVKNADGSVMIPAQTHEALENAMTLNPTGVESTKGEIFDDLWHVANYWGKQKTQTKVEVPTGVIGPDGKELTRTETRTEYTPQARALRDLLIARASSWGRNDPGGKVKLHALLDNLELSPEERARTEERMPLGEMSAEEAERARKAAEEANKNGPGGH